MVRRLRKIEKEDYEDVPEDEDFAGDPEEIVRSKITPRMLRKLYESLDSNVPTVIDRAIDKAIKVDKRFNPKDATTPAQTLVLNFDSNHLKEIPAVLKTMFGKEPDAKPLSDK